MKGEAFAYPVRRFGLLSLLGLFTFASSLIVMHAMNNDIDWLNHYVSNLANEPFGWVFVSAAFVHGLGNLALVLGLRGSLHPGRLRSWAVLLFGLAAAGILVAAVFPTDRPDQIPSLTGRVHRIAASSTFLLELTALFVFSIAFGHDDRWRRQRIISLALSVVATITMGFFIVAVLTGVAPGLAERVALVVLLAWEIWISFLLVRPT